MCCLVLGIIASIIGLIAVFDGNDYHGGGLCLIGAAISFGLAANAVLRQ